jgi:hypothetical protein
LNLLIPLLLLPAGNLGVVETELLGRAGGRDDSVLELELEPSPTTPKEESWVLNRSTGRISRFPCSAFLAIAENATLASSMPALNRFLECGNCAELSVEPL